MMKYRLYKQLIGALMGIVMCVCVTLPAFAEDVKKDSKSGPPAFTLGVRAFAQSGHTTVNLWWDETDGAAYLFLPGQCDPSALTVCLTGDGSVSVDDVPLVNGAVTGAFTAGEHTLSCGGQSYRLQVLRSAALPSVFIDTASGSLAAIQADKNHSEAGSITVVADGKLSIDNAALKSVKGRGNSTWNADKKPYNIKFDKKTDVLGMGKAKKWSLLANHYDASLLRNSLALDLAKAFGLPFTSDYRMADLYVNGEYQGNYLIVESVEIGETRVAIADLEDANEAANPQIDVEEADRKSATAEDTAASRKWVDIAAPDDVTGGYLLETEFADRYRKEVSGFVTGHGQHVVLKSPEYAAAEEVKYIADLYGEMEQALYAPDGYNAKGRHYTEYFDMDQLVKMYILTEYAFHRDAGLSSCYFYKDAGETILHAGPAWDFDLSMGNTRFRDLLPFDVGNAGSWWANSMFYNDANQEVPTVFTLLYKHEDFRAMVSAQWQVLSKTVAAELEQLPRMIDGTAPSAVMNALRWRLLSGETAAQKEAAYRKGTAALERFAAARADALDKGFGADAAMVYYDTNGGSGYVFNGAMLTVGDTVVLRETDNKVTPVNAPEGCEFLGWNTEADGSGDLYRPGDLVPVTAKTTVFYAQWQKAGAAPQPPVSEGVSFALGDIDRNGAVEPADARLALRASVNLVDLDQPGRQLADADGDQTVSAADARLILRASVKLQSLPTRPVFIPAA